MWSGTKAERVARYADTIRNHVEMIAHSCGVAEPRQLRREHVRIIQETGRSLPMTAIDFLPPGPQGPAPARIPPQP